MVPGRMFIAIDVVSFFVLGGTDIPLDFRILMFDQ